MQTEKTSLFHLTKPQYMRFAFKDFDGVDIFGFFYIDHFCIQIRKNSERRNHV